MYGEACAWARVVVCGMNRFIACTSRDNGNLFVSKLTIDAHEFGSEAKTHVAAGQTQK